MRWKPFLACLLFPQPLLGQETPKPGSGVPSSHPSAELPSFELSGTPEEGLFFVFKPFPLEQSDTVDIMVAAETKLRCAPKKRVFQANYRKIPGNIKVMGRTVAGMVRYETLALCVGPRELISPVSSVFHPTPDDEKDLLSAFHAHFSAFDASDVDALMPLRDYPPLPRKVLLEEIRNDKLQYGERKRTILKTSWYPNPPELHNGIFGEVLFSQPVSSSRTLCRAAMFYKRGEHDFLFSRLLTVPIAGPSKGKKDLKSCLR